MNIEKALNTSCFIYFYENDGLGAGRLSRKPRPVQRFERLGAPMVSETSCFTRFLRIMSVSLPLCLLLLLTKTLCF